MESNTRFTNKYHPEDPLNQTLPPPLTQLTYLGLVFKDVVRVTISVKSSYA